MLPISRKKKKKKALQWGLGSLFILICFSLSFSSPLPYPQDSLYYMWSVPYVVKSMEIPVPGTVLGGQMWDLSILQFN